MLDLHCHVLPGIDDGPRSIEGSMALLRAMADQGVQHVVATPHIYPGVFDNTADTIRAAFDQVLEAANRADLPLTMSWGAEVRLCSEMLDWIDQGLLPYLGRHADGGHTVLLELPDGQIPVGAHALVARLRARDVQVLIAHPERNRAICANPDLLWPLMDNGARLQLTAASLIGEFGRRAESTARFLLDQHPDWVVAVASDAHSMRSRPPRLGAAKAWLTQNYSLERAEDLTERLPARWAGIGQIVFQGIDGTALRDLDAPAPQRVFETALWSLNDLSTAAPPSSPAGSPALGAPIPFDPPTTQIDARAGGSDWLDSLGDLPSFAAAGATTPSTPLELRDDLLSTSEALGILNMEPAMDSVTQPSCSDAWSLDTVFDETQPAALFIPPLPEDTPAIEAVTLSVDVPIDATGSEWPASPTAEPVNATGEEVTEAEAEIELAAPLDTGIELAQEVAPSEAPAEVDLAVALASTHLDAAPPLRVNESPWSRPVGGGDTWREPKLRLAYQRIEPPARPTPPTLNDVVSLDEEASAAHTAEAPSASRAEVVKADQGSGARIIELNFGACEPHTPLPTPPGEIPAAVQIDAVELARAPTPHADPAPDSSSAPDGEPAQAPADATPETMATAVEIAPQGSWWKSITGRLGGLMGRKTSASEPSHPTANAPEPETPAIPVVAAEPVAAAVAPAKVEGEAPAPLARAVRVDDEPGDDGFPATEILHVAEDPPAERRRAVSVEAVKPVSAASLGLNLPSRARTPLLHGEGGEERPDLWRVAQAARTQPPAPTATPGGPVRKGLRLSDIAPLEESR